MNGEPVETAVAKDHTVHLIGCPALNGSPGCTCAKPEKDEHDNQAAGEPQYQK